MAWMSPLFARSATVTKALILLGVCSTASFALAQDDAAQSSTAQTAPQPIVAARNSQRVMLGTDAVRRDATIHYHILQDNVSQLRLGLPAGSKVLGVAINDRGVNDWIVADESQRQVLTIPLPAALRLSADLEVLTEASFVTGDFAVAGTDESGAAFGIHVLDDPGESGTVTVSAAPEIALKFAPAAGAVRIQPDETVDSPSTPAVERFRYFNPKFAIKVHAEPKAPRISVEQVTRATFVDKQLRLAVDLKYDIREAGTSRLKIEVPQGLEIDGEDIAADSMEDFEIDESTGALTIILKGQQQGSVSVSFSGRRYLEDTDFTEPTPLPLFHPEGVVNESGQIDLYAGPGIDVLVDGKERTGVQHANLADGPPPVEGTRAVSSWSYRRQPVTFSVSISRKAPRVAATAASNVTIHGDAVDVNTDIDFDVHNAAIDTFRIAIPADAANVKVEADSQSNAVPVRQVVRDEKPTGDFVVLTVTSERPISGRWPVNVSYALKSTGKQSNAVQFKAAMPRVDGYSVKESEGKSTSAPVDQFEGEASIQADDGLIASADPSLGPVKSIELDGLQRLPHHGLLAYRWTEQPVAFQITSTSAEANDSAQTVVSRAAVELSAGNGDQMTWRWRGQVRTSERHRVVIELPSGSEIVAATINSRPTTTEKAPAENSEEGWDRYAVNVVRATPSDQPFLLALQYRSPAPSRAFAPGSGDLHLNLPRLRDQNGIAPVYQLRAAVSVPRNIVLLGLPDESLTAVPDSSSNGSATSSIADELDTWVGATDIAPIEAPTSSHAYFYQPTAGGEPLRVRWWQMTFYTRVLSGALIVIGLLLCLTSWRNRLIVLALAGLAFLIFAFENPTVAWYGLKAARYGMIGIALIWLIQAALRRPSAPVASKVADKPRTEPIPVSAPPAAYATTISRTQVAEPEA